MFQVDDLYLMRLIHLIISAAVAGQVTLGQASSVIYLMTVSKSVNKQDLYTYMTD